LRELHGAGPDPEPRTTTLPNGVRVVSDAMPHARSVTTGVWVSVGGRDEHPRLAGASHFLEHLFFKGTEARSARSIAEAVDAVGGDMNAFTAREHTTFVTRLPAAHWRLGVELLGDILSAPALRPHEIDAEREVILEELWAALDTPEDRVHTLSMEALFPGHALGREVLGDEETVRAMRREDILGFFETHYRPANLVVAAAGRVDHDELCEAVQERLGGGDGGQAPEREAPDDDVEPLRTQTRDGEQVHVVLGWRGLPLDHDDRYALHVADQVLGGGSSSRLFQAIREERGLAYSVYSWVSSYSDAGLLGVYAGTSPGRSPQLIDALESEIDAVLTDGVTADEVRVAVGYLTGATELGLEDSGSRMTRLGRMLLSTGQVVSIDEQLERLHAVTVDDVDRVLQAVLRSPRSVAAVGPVDVDRLGQAV
jgi:predicted Zn-dependent peptidase